MASTLKVNLSPPWTEIQVILERIPPEIRPLAEIDGNIGVGIRRGVTQRGRRVARGRRPARPRLPILVAADRAERRSHYEHRQYFSVHHQSHMERVACPTGGENALSVPNADAEIVMFKEIWVLYRID